MLYLASLLFCVVCYLSFVLCCMLFLFRFVLYVVSLSFCVVCCFSFVLCYMWFLFRCVLYLVSLLFCAVCCFSFVLCLCCSSFVLCYMWFLFRFVFMLFLFRFVLYAFFLFRFVLYIISLSFCVICGLSFVLVIRRTLKKKRYTRICFYYIIFNYSLELWLYIWWLEYFSIYYTGFNVCYFYNVFDCKPLIRLVFAVCGDHLRVCPYGRPAVCGLVSTIILCKYLLHTNICTNM